MANMYGAFIDTPCGCESCWWLAAGERLTARQLVAGGWWRGGAYGAAGIGIGIGGRLTARQLAAEVIEL